MVSNASSPDNDMASIIGNEWASRIYKQVSDLKNIVRSLQKSEISKYKYKIIETRKGGESVKLCCEVQNLAPSIVEEGSVNSMKSGRFEKEIMLSDALIGGSKAKTNLKNVMG